MNLSHFVWKKVFQRRIFKRPLSSENWLKKYIFSLKILHQLGNQLTPVRHDRDDFIRVNEENIAPKMKNNFVKREYGDAAFHTARSVDPKHTPYDVLSVIVV